MNWKKFTFTAVLGIIILLASFFMITESARYYTFFYKSGAWQPLFLASLLEIFVLALAAMKIGTKRLFNFIQKFIMVSVFTVIIVAAGIQAIDPTLKSIETVSKQEALSDILKEEYKTLQKDREVFEKQKQRRNTAIAAAERRKIVEDLKSLFKQDIKTDKGRVAILNIIMLFTIRFIVQLSNVFCASMLGVYFRDRKNITGENNMRFNIFKRKPKKQEPKKQEPKKLEMSITLKDLVLFKFPKAHCQKTILPNKVKYRIFSDKKSKPLQMLSIGVTEEMAWRKAGAKLKKGIL